MGAVLSDSQLCINVEVCWSPTRFCLVSVSVPKNHLFVPNFHCRFSYLQSSWIKWMLLPTLLRVVGWSKAYGQFSIDFTEGLDNILVFIWTWDRDTFRRVCVGVLSKYSGDASREVAVLGRVLVAIGTSVSIVSLLGSHLCSATRTLNFWALGTMRSWWSVLSSTCRC